MFKFNIYKNLKILTINIFLFLIIFVLVDLILGFFYGNIQFSHFLSSKRIVNKNITYEFDDEKIRLNYQRDYYGFRNNSDFKKYDLKDVKIILTGGSTSDELILPYEKTIVGKLNSYFLKDKFKHKIYNASENGKSLRGIFHDFDKWFGKLDNFSPDYMIFYIGINERDIKYVNYQKEDEVKPSLKELIMHYSFFLQKKRLYERLKFIENDNKIFEARNLGGYFVDNENIMQNIRNSEVINYKKAKKIYKLNKKNKEILNAFSFNLNLLKKILKKKRIQPIFISQIDYKVNGDDALFFLNQKLEEFCVENKFHIIALNKIINENKIGNFFVDYIHTNADGSEFIAKKIYPELIKILN
jgi:lysophospholipase L1-like esterase